jgi:hypothetical protein
LQASRQAGRFCVCEPGAAASGANAISPLEALHILGRLAVDRDCLLNVWSSEPIAVNEDVEGSEDMSYYCIEEMEVLYLSILSLVLQYARSVLMLYRSYPSFTSAPAFPSMTTLPKSFIYMPTASASNYHAPVYSSASNHSTHCTS